MERQDELPGLMYEKAKETNEAREVLSGLSATERLDLKIELGAKRDELDKLLNTLNDLSELENE